MGPSICDFLCIDATNLYVYEAADPTVLKYSNKPCDDGNINVHDGCTYECIVETGWECGGGTPTSPDTCEEICGDGLVWGTHECDDGNNVSGDGCSEDCEIEDGWECDYGHYPWPDICW